MGLKQCICYDEAMKSKAIIFDIDGTAINSPSQKLPSDRLIKAVRNLEEEYFITAATGRVWTFAEPVLKGLSLVDPCIISSGTQICNPVTGEIMWQCDLDNADLAATLAIAKKYPEYKVLYNDNDEDTYLNGGLDVASLQIAEPVYFFELIFVPQNIAPQIVAELSKIEGIAVTLVVALRAGFNDIHITNRNATKECTQC
jgi:hydroxymethylpyrimidine pyrophosphatase-like HAD family hydrolase